VPNAKNLRGNHLKARNSTLAGIAIAALALFLSACDTGTITLPSDLTGTKWTGTDSNGAVYTTMFLESGEYFVCPADADGSWQGVFDYSWDSSTGTGSYTDGDQTWTFGMAKDGKSITANILPTSGSTAVSVTLSQKPVFTTLASFVGSSWAYQDASNQKTNLTINSDTGALRVEVGTANSKGYFTSTTTVTSGTYTFSTSTFSGTFTVGGTTYNYTLNSTRTGLTLDSAYNGITYFQLHDIASDYAY
jgi:hypothetical protein